MRNYCLAAALFGVFECLMPSICRADTRLYPPNGPEGNYHIVVLSDGFAQNEQQDFESVAATVITGAFADSFYAHRSAAFSVVSVFRAAPATGASNYGFRLATSNSRCAIEWDDDTTSNPTSVRIEKALEGVPHRRVLVISNYTGYHFGCSDGIWTYLTTDVQYHHDVLRHELGHLIGGLFDEYFPDPPTEVTYNGEPVLRLNCSTADRWAWSTKFPASTGPDGCLLATSGIFRPFDDCRMRHSRTAFCEVCADAMSSVLDDFINHQISAVPTHARVAPIAFVQQPPRVNGNRSVRLLVSLNAATKVATVLSADDEQGPVVASHKRLGDVVYEITDGGAPVETSVLVGDPFQTRSYGGGGTPHASRPAPVASVLVFVPRVDRQTILSRNIAITFYRLSPSAGVEDVTPEVLRGLKSSNDAVVIGAVAPDQLKRVVSAGRKGGRAL